MDFIEILTEDGGVLLRRDQIIAVVYEDGYDYAGVVVDDAPQLKTRMSYAEVKALLVPQTETSGEHRPTFEEVQDTMRVMAEEVSESIRQRVAGNVDEARRLYSVAMIRQAEILKALFPEQ